MANQGAKKVVEKNKQRMELLWRIILGSNVSGPLLVLLSTPQIREFAWDVRRSLLPDTLYLTDLQ
jgi:hypothetical protein